MGLFAPANADAALAVLDMMDFEGIEKVRERVQQNGTLYTQLQRRTDHRKDGDQRPGGCGGRRRQQPGHPGGKAGHERE